MKTDLIKIPNVGTNTKQDFINIGITCIEDLKGKNPEQLYLQDCEFKKYKEDRCQLYLFRMAVYYAEKLSQSSEILKLV